MESTIAWRWLKPNVTQVPCPPAATYLAPFLLPSPVTTPGAPVAPPSSWNRVPDATIIKIEAKFADKTRAKVAQAEVKKLVETMATDLGMPLETFKIESNELSEHFVLRFGGLSPLAAKQALAFIKGTKLPDGGFRDLGLLDPSGHPVQLYLNLDKNGRQRKLEGATRRLAGLVVKAYPALKTKVFPRRGEGIVNLQFRLLASISVTPEATSLSWNIRWAASQGVDMEAIKTEFLEAENIQWGS
jgi:hypothetical protein